MKLLIISLLDDMRPESNYDDQENIASDLIDTSPQKYQKPFSGLWLKLLQQTDTMLMLWNTLEN